MQLFLTSQVRLIRKQFITLALKMPCKNGATYSRQISELKN